MNHRDTGPATLREQLFRAARGSVLVRVAALATAVVSSVVLARAMGARGLGTYAFVLAVVTLLALPSQVGIPTLLVRETARSHAAEAWSEMRGLWRWATRTILTTSLAIAGLAFAVVLALGDRLDDALRDTLLAGLVLVPLVALGNARGAALRGLRRVVAGQLPESLLRPGLLVIAVALAWTALAGNVSPSTAMWLHVVAAVAAFAIGVAMLWRARPAGVAAASPDLSRASAWWRSALPLALIGGLQVIGNQSGIVLLGLFQSGPDVGMYKVAASAASLAVIGLQTANMVLGPYVARLHATGEHARLQRIASAGALASAAMTVPVFVAFLGGGQALVSLLYGAEFAGAHAPLVVLTAAQVVNAGFGSVGLLLNMTGHERDAARWLAVASAVQLLLGALLVPAFGMLGAAAATFVSTTVWNVAFWLVAKHRLGIDGSVLGALARGRP